MTGVRAKSSLAAVCAIFLAGSAVAAETDALTVGELIANAQEYDGMLVRVRGQFDNCAGPGCAFCPEDMTTETFKPENCLKLAFGAYDENTEWSSAFAALEQERYRFSTATIEARFTTFCMTQGMILEGTNDVILCMGFTENLGQAKVIEVHSRASVLDGLIGWPGHDPLRAPPPETREAMLAALDEANMQTCVGDLQDACEVFELVLSDLALENKRRGSAFIVDGLACVCREEDCDGRWPSRHVWGMNSPANPFECWGMQNRDGRWHLVIDGI